MHRYKGKEYGDKQLTELLIDVGAERREGGKWYFDAIEYDNPSDILLLVEGVERQYIVTADLCVTLAGVTRTVWRGCNAETLDFPEEILAGEIGSLTEEDLATAQWGWQDFFDGTMEAL